MSPKEFYSAVESLIKQSRKTYAESPKVFVGYYNQENELTHEYNGRQILELLQNADDAGSNTVQLTLNRPERKLVIANQGAPFTIGGIESLMIPNLSTKTQRKFIGNKGLGFRSILNWASHVQIKTNGCIVQFSPEIAKEEFNNLLTDSEQRNALLRERGLAENAIPFPILAIPRIALDETPTTSWSTVIEISYQEPFEEQIKSQLIDFREEILLFLNEVEIIRILGVYDRDVEFKRDKVEDEGLKYIQIGNKVWRVESEDAELPSELQDAGKSEMEAYCIIIAFQEDLSDSYYRLFNYFPTKLSIYLPCVIHATFELNSSRDYLNDSTKNQFILKQLARVLRNTAKKLASETAGKANWNPLRLIFSAKTESDSELVKAFYKYLEQLVKELKVFPCADGQYVSFNEFKFYGNSFSQWVVDNQYGPRFPNLILPVDKLVLDSLKIVPKGYPNQEFVELIDKLGLEMAEARRDIQIRANLIGTLLEDGFQMHNGTRYSLLTNEHDNVINKSIVAFTPKEEGIFSKPDFISIDFINPLLYQILVAKHKANFEKEEPQESRQFQRFFKDILNVQPYDFSNIITKIITGTREKVRYGKESAIASVKETVKCLFDNYDSQKDKAERFTEPSCPLINRQNEVKESDELFLSATYPAGKKVELIYEGVLSDEDYLQDASFYGITDVDQTVTEAFFTWLGVNKSAQFKAIEINKPDGEPEPYLKFAFSKVPKPEVVSKWSFKGTELGLFNKTIQQLSNEKLLALILIEEKLLHALDLTNNDELRYQYARSYPIVPLKPSYIAYQLSKLDKFTHYLIEHDNLPLINEIQINYNDSVFKELGFQQRQIEDVLEKLGALRSLKSFTTERLMELIKKYGELKIDHKNARKLYLSAFEVLKERKETNQSLNRRSFKLLATKNGTRDYVAAQEVYYADNTTLPAKITQQLWMFDFPKRSGELQVSNIFGTRTLHELEILVDTDSIELHPEQELLNRWINNLKPLILAYRISTFNKNDEKVEAANALKRFCLHLVSAVSYSLNGQSQILEKEEFIVDNKKYFICAEYSIHLPNLRSSLRFCNSFAEIMCIVFKTNENKNNYIAVFKNEIAFTKELIRADEQEDNLLEAYKLLGLNPSELDFWEATCNVCGKSWDPEIHNEEELAEFTKKMLGYDLPGFYNHVDFENYSNKESLDFVKDLCSAKGISQIAIKNRLPSFPGLYQYHFLRMQNECIDLKNKYAIALWHELNSRMADDQKNFIKRQSDFSSWLSEYVLNLAKQRRYDFDIDYKDLLTSAVNGQFNLTLNDDYIEIRIQPTYQILLNGFDEIEKNFSHEERSLLYFEGNDDLIKSFIESLNSESSNAVPIANGEGDTDSLPILEIEFVTPHPSSGDSTETKKDRRFPRIVGPKHESYKRRAGKKAEIKVKLALINQYGRSNVQWVSGNSNETVADDTLGYDFLYRKSEAETNWNCLEVKSVGDSSFIISSHEMDVAFKAKSRYHLALVKSDKILINTNYFMNDELEQEYKQITSVKSIRPLDFEIYFSEPQIDGEQADEFLGKE